MIDTSAIKAKYDLRLYMTGKTRSHGQPVMIQCPFHDDSDPSCGVWEDHFHCFGCGITDDIIGYVMRMKGITFEEACEFLDAGSTVDYSRKVSHEPPPPPRQLDPDIVKKAHARYKEGLPFFQQRGIDPQLGFRKWLGVTTYTWHYKFADGTALAVPHRRYVVPDVFNKKLRSIIYRRDDESVNQYLAESGHLFRIIDDLSKIYGVGKVPQKKLMDRAGGPKYIQEAGSQWKLFNLDSLVEFEDGQRKIKPVEALLLHSEPQQFDTLAVMSLGYTSLGVPQKKDVLAMLPALTRDIPLVYIIGQNDEAGIAKAQNVARAVGKKAIVIFPPTPISFHGQDIPIKDDGDLAKVGQLQSWLSKSIGISV